MAKIYQAYLLGAIGRVAEMHGKYYAASVSRCLPLRTCFCKRIAEAYNDGPHPQPLGRPLRELSLCCGGGSPKDSPSPKVGRGG